MTHDEDMRLTRLEIRHEHIAETVDKMSGKVDELHRIMTEAKGAKWAIMSVVGVLSFIGGTVATLATWFGSKP